MKLVLSKQERYIPSSYKNLMQKEDEQIAVHLTFPAVGEIKGLRRLVYGTDGKSVTIEYDYKRILDRYVGTIENLSVEIDGKTIEVESGLKLTVLPSMQELADELCLYLTGRTPSEAAKKN